MMDILIENIILLDLDLFRDIARSSGPMGEIDVRPLDPLDRVRER